MAELHADDEHRRECLAKHLLRSWTHKEITDWLKKPQRSEAYREDMRDRLNRLKQENRKR